MSQKRNLGPILALTGAGIALAAVIAGFLITGGPGDARDRRLDAMTTQRLYSAATLANCAFAVEGSAPQDLSAAYTRIEAAIRSLPDKLGCGHVEPESGPRDVDYTRIDDSHIRLCEDFLRPYSGDPQDQRRSRRYGYMDFPELQSPRPAGRHCYEIELTRPPETLSQ